jgi:hypothetical protein
VKELNLEILLNDKNIFSFVFFYKFYLIIQKIQAKFLVGENKYTCGYFKSIWIIGFKCNIHIQVRFDITHR